MALKNGEANCANDEGAQVKVMFSSGGKNGEKLAARCVVEYAAVGVLNKRDAKHGSASRGWLRRGIQGKSMSKKADPTKADDF